MSGLGGRYSRASSGQIKNPTVSSRLYICYAYLVKLGGRKQVPRLRNYDCPPRQLHFVLPIRQYYPSGDESCMIVNLRQLSLLYLNTTK